MAGDADNPLDNGTQSVVKNSKILLVGAGGIGCELLKNLVLAGFEDIHLIDLDTIDVSNLNRQFLFQKQHVGKPKAIIAKESALVLNPNAKITAYHDSITNPEYNMTFYKQFNVVLNALDNMAARKHVNRMCLTADIPLVESGSTGYKGHVTVHKKKLTECYECLPRPAPKDFPTCTIRNTPSEPIHCIVWAKHLFNQLFGEEDPHQEVSPDPTDEQNNDNSDGSSNSKSNSSNSHEEKCSTREWAKKCQYHAETLFKKLFQDDIKYLLEMKHLWENRTPPTPLDWNNLPDAVATSSRHIKPALKDEEIWSIKECAQVFQSSLSSLRAKLDDPSCDGQLIWDKDDDKCMDFVAACANIRAYCFKISQLCRFKIKSMAGNIIPAIATTNAVIGGLIVLQLFKILMGQIAKCRTVILNKSIAQCMNKLISAAELVQANPDCFVCSPNTQEVHIQVNTRTLTLKTLQEKILIGTLNMVEPDVIFDDGKGTIVISSEPEDMQGMFDKTLESFGMLTGSRLKCDDYFQNFKLVAVIDDDSSLVDQDFKIISDVSSLKPKENEPENNEPSTSSTKDEDDDVCEVDRVTLSYKRKHSDDENGISTPKKRVRRNSGDSEEIIVI